MTIRDQLAPVVARIVLRYLSGALMAWGGGVAATGQALLAAPEIEAAVTLIVGAGIGAAVEWIYARARVSGGPT